MCNELKSPAARGYSEGSNWVVVWVAFQGIERSIVTLKLEGLLLLFPNSQRWLSPLYPPSPPNPSFSGLNCKMRSLSFLIWELPGTSCSFRSLYRCIGSLDKSVVWVKNFVHFLFFLTLIQKSFLWEGFLFFLFSSSFG